MGSPFTRLTSRDRVAWAVAGFLVLLLMVVIIVMGPIRREFSRLDENAANQERELTSNLRLLSKGSEESVKRDYSRYGNYIKKTRSTAEENAAMLAEIEDLASRNKISLAATKPHDVHPDKDFEEYAVDVEIEADVLKIMGFLYALESSPQLLRVDRLVLDSKAAKEPGVLKGSLTVTKVVTL